MAAYEPSPGMLQGNNNRPERLERDPLKGNIMNKQLKLVTAAALMFAATSAFAGSDDGNVANEDGTPGVQQSQPAPAPVAASSAIDNTPTYDSGVISPNP
jgi:hypothetical protein